MKKKQTETVVVLHDVRSTHNVGSVFRTADAAGVDTLYLTGYTPTPVDRFGRKNTALSKVALGAEETVVWEKSDDVLALLGTLKGEGFEIVGVEQVPHSVSYVDAQLSSKRVFIFGNEVDGIPEKVVNFCDQIIEIPMHGKKESLNVSVTVGVILFNALR